METRGSTAGAPTVLIVEDEELLALSTREALRDVAINAITAASGAEALDVFASYPFHAAIIDIGLPDMPGTELARHFRRRHADLPIVLCSGFDCTGYVVEFRNDSRVRVIEKPFDEPHLLAQLLALGVPVGSSIA
ncbi:MAG TPA: response regulator [Povalibacter sp.]|nr:response regulator [Povalibacter sp.]